MEARARSALGMIAWSLLAQMFAAATTMSLRPVPEVELTAAESAGLSLFYVAMIFLAATILVLLVRMRKALVIKAVVVITFTFSVWVALDTILQPLVPLPQSILLVAALALSALSLSTGLIGNLAKSIVSASLGFLFVSFFNDLFIYFFLALLSIYDTYSVFKGPLSKILMVSSEEALSPLVITQGEVTMGVGDAFCYSMAAAVSVRSLPLPLSVVPILSLNLGVALTLWVLIKRRRPLPGLSIPVLFWLVTQLALTGASL